ncbi:MAG: energy transducer TonB [Bacteroidota bacterium]
MKNYIFPFLFALIGFLQIKAQSDTTIYDIVEQMPRFPMCEALDTTIAAKQACSQQALLAVIYQNVQYPMQARIDGIEGSVVVSFVVEPDSTVSNATILRDIGGGCGMAVLSVVNAFNDAGIRWIPAQKAGTDVRAKMTVPIKFRLEEAPPYVFIEGDTVYMRLDSLAQFAGGDTALDQYIAEKLNYPEIYKDTCLIGYVDVQLLIEPDGIVKTTSMSDYSELGLDFQLEIVNLTTSMFGKWEAAKYQGRKVPSTVDLRLGFVPPNKEACKAEISVFEQASTLAAEGMQLYNSGEQEAGLAKLTEAIAIDSNNAEYLTFRGQAHVDAERYREACIDLLEARRILGTASFDQLLMIICRMEEGEQEE